MDSIDRQRIIESRRFEGIRAVEADRDVKLDPMTCSICYVLSSAIVPRLALPLCGSNRSIEWDGTDKTQLV